MRKTGDWFGRFASHTARLAGRPLTFAVAVAFILAWAVTGPFMGFSEVWQLTINTGTTIITFLMVFIIQNTQNRDGAAVQIKLDELIRVTADAHNALLNLEDLSEEEIEKLRRHYERLAQEAVERGGKMAGDRDD